MTAPGDVGREYREDGIYDVVRQPERSPSPPFRAPTLYTPAAELFVEIESRSAITQLDIGEPLCNDIQGRRIEPDDGSDDGDNEPCLTSLIRVPELAAPTADPVVAKEASVLFLSRPSTEPLPCIILHPIYRGEVLVSLDLSDFFRDRVHCRIGRGSSMLALLERRDRGSAPGESSFGSWGPSLGIRMGMHRERG